MDLLDAEKKLKLSTSWLDCLASLSWIHLIRCCGPWVMDVSKKGTWFFSGSDSSRPTKIYDLLARPTFSPPAWEKLAGHTPSISVKYIIPSKIYSIFSETQRKWNKRLLTRKNKVTTLYISLAVVVVVGALVNNDLCVGSHRSGRILKGIDGLEGLFFSRWATSGAARHEMNPSTDGPAAAGSLWNISERNKHAAGELVEL